MVGIADNKIYPSIATLMLHFDLTGQVDQGQKYGLMINFKRKLLRAFTLAVVEKAGWSDTP